MKTLFISRSTCLMTMALISSAFADYKTIELANGTNEVSITGAYLPIAIEVKSTVSNKTVKVDRASEVDLLRKCYDVTTNAIPWTETQITTNDYFTVTNRNVSQIGLCTGYDEFYADESCALVGSFYYTNAAFKGTRADVVLTKEFVCRGNGLYVSSYGTGLLWGSAPTSETAAVTQPMSSGAVYNYTSCAYGNGKFVAYGRYPAVIPNYAAIVGSNDGKNWAVLSNNVENSYDYSVCFTKNWFFLKLSSMLMSANGTDWSVSYTSAVSTVSHVDGKYAILANNSILFSDDAKNWSVVTGVLAGTSSRLCAVRAWNAFLVGSSSGIYVLKTDGTCQKYNGAIEDATWDEAAYNGYIYTGHSKLYGPSGSRVYTHTSGSVGQNETWTHQKTQYDTWILGYKPNQWHDSAAVYDYDGYWKVQIDGMTRYSKNSDQRPSTLVLDRMINEQTDISFLSPLAYLTYSRTTNYIEHIRYEYVTNRVYNVLDRSVTKVAKIVDAQCAEGIRSQDITNRVFVLNGDKLVVDGVSQGELESTKATLICE